MPLLQCVKGDVLVVLVELGGWLVPFLRFMGAYLGRYCLRGDGCVQVSPQRVVILQACIAVLRDLGLPIYWLHLAKNKFAIDN